MEYCLVNIRVPLNPKSLKSRGSLFHYGHFILDFALPFLKLYKSKNIKILYLPPFSCMGTMAPIFHTLFPGIKLIQGSPNNIPKLVLAGYCRLNFHTDFIDETNLFHKYVMGLTKSRATLKNKWPEVILIQRSQTNIHKQRLNGSGRRRIANHSHLRQLLSLKYGSDFENVVLENMDFFTQVAYFSRARLVIGQYGSGLVNILWMNPGTACIELTTRGLYERDPVFVKCCQARDVSHYPVFCVGSAKTQAWKLPINAFKQTLEKYDSEASR